MIRLFGLLLLLGCLAPSVWCSTGEYVVELVSKAPTPPISIVNEKGKGYTPCEYTFNPAWLPVGPSLSQNMLLVRTAKCPADWGGEADHIMYAFCHANGTCGDLQNVVLPLEHNAQDPRVVFYEGYYYLFYYASGSGEQTVYLRKTATPLDAKSWEHVAGPLPWHRNGCVLLRDEPPHYVIFGEAPPLPAIGLASTTNFSSFEVVNASFFKANGPDNSKEPEIVLEASTPLVKLSTGDYLHLYSAGTPGWVAHGNYTAGWVILDGKNPNVIKQRSTEHILVSSLPYEIGNGKYPVQRHRTIFATSLVPTGVKDEFRVWYGAADANVGTAILRVTPPSPFI